MARQRYVKNCLLIISLLLVAFFLTSTLFPATNGLSASPSSLINSPSTLNNHANEAKVYLNGIPVGSQPDEIAYDRANNSLYVANFNSSNISVISATANEVTASIGIQTPNGLAYDTVNNCVYSTGSNGLYVINTSTNKIADTVVNRGGFWGVTYDSANNSIYALNDAYYTVYAVNASTNRVITTLNLKSPLVAAYDSENNCVYVVSDVTDDLTIINATTNTIFDTINGSTFYAPEGIVYDSADNTIYVANTGSNFVYVVNASTNNVVADVIVGMAPMGIAYDSANNTVYVANSGSNSVSVIDASTNSVIANVGVGKTPFGAAYDSADNRIYISNVHSDNISVINASTNKIIAIPVNLYTVTFNETGLPNGTEWYVSAKGGTPNVSSTNTLSMSLQNGTYTFSISNLSNYYVSENSITATVRGKNLTENVVFLHYAYITGTLSPPNATLTINGKSVPITPGGRFNITVTAGNYTVQVHLQGYYNYDANLSILNGENKKLNITLIKPVSPYEPNWIVWVAVTSIVGSNIYFAFRNRRHQ